MSAETFAGWAKRKRDAAFRGPCPRCGGPVEVDYIEVSDGMYIERIPATYEHACGAGDEGTQP